MERRKGVVRARIESERVVTPEQFEDVQELYLAALERETASRTHYVQYACGGDDVLAREVLSLLAYHGATGPLDASAVGDGEYLLDLLARSADADLASPQASDVVENESVRIGPYRTIREIGRGGMGTVYLAVRDDGQFRQEVALKLLRGSIATDDFVRRFRRERQILAGIEHPNIARLVDGGRTTDGLPYFVMEYIDGTPVDTFCDTHELDTRERVRLVRKVCSAVQLAHQNFVIHRDLKPANILVTQDGEPKLLDFGIAKVLDGHEIADDTSATKLDTRLMTPDYASPEQILGENITTASDVYYKLRHPTYPIRHRRHRDPRSATRVDAMEPVKRDVIHVLAYHHVSQQRSVGTAALQHRSRALRCRDPASALPARVLLKVVDVLDEVTGHVGQSPADILAERLLEPAALRAAALLLQ